MPTTRRCFRRGTKLSMRWLPTGPEQETRARLKEQIDHSRQALALSRTRYETGVTDFITVLVADRTLLQAELQYAQSTASVSTNLVQLYKALGGGWEQTFPEEPAAGPVALQ